MYFRPICSTFCRFLHFFLQQRKEQATNPLPLSNWSPPAELKSGKGKEGVAEEREGENRHNKCKGKRVFAPSPSSFRNRKRSSEVESLCWRKPEAANPPLPPSFLLRRKEARSKNFRFQCSKKVSPKKVGGKARNYYFASYSTLGLGVG